MNQKITITDSECNENNLKYVLSAVDKTIFKLGGKTAFLKSGDRSKVEIYLDETTMRFIRPTLMDKIADTISVNYKYEYFKRYIRTAGLDELEYELLLCALISADLDDDKRYIRQKLKGEELTIDGAFNFTMKPLKSKWNEVVSYIPSSFTKKQLFDFISYLINEKRSRRVYVDGKNVFDKHFNIQKRTELINFEKARIIREIILSSASEVELGAKIPESDEYYLKEFFNDKIFFSKTYFS